jgi:hypothetical protein
MLFYFLVENMTNELVMLLKSVCTVQTNQVITSDAVIQRLKNEVPCGTMCKEKIPL